MSYKVRAIVLNTNKITGIGSINVVVYLKSENKREIIYFPTQIKIEKKSFVNGKVITGKIKNETNSSIQNEILKIDNEIKKLEIQNITISKQSIESLKEKKLIHSFILTELIEMTKIYKLSNNKNINPINYISIIKNIEEYEKTKNKGDKLTIKNINQLLINNIFEFWRQKGIKGSTQRNYIINLKSVFKHLHQTKIINGEYTSLNYEVKSYESNLPTLSEEEIQILLSFKPNHPTKILAQKLFLVQMMTSLRFSDLHNITPESISNDSIELFLKKNKQSIKIPIHKNLKIILETIDYDVRNLAININYFNTALKKLFQDANLNRKIQTISENKGNPVAEYKPLYKVISSHVARRTAITIFSEMGLEISEIKSITGHKNINSIDRYIKISDAHKKSKMDEYSKKFDIK